METELIICANCKKEFKRAIKKTSKGYFKEDKIRSCNCITCCPNCSKELNYNLTHRHTKLLNGEILPI
jgi:hypothetical protein